MSKRELKISDKELYSDTKEEMIFRSPLKIPIKGLQELINLKGVKSIPYAYYDISPTEQQIINTRSRVEIPPASFVPTVDDDLKMKMGEFEDI